MNEANIISELIGKGGVAALLSTAVWYIAKKLATVYEQRIAALEMASKACEDDRIFLRGEILKIQGNVLQRAQFSRTAGLEIISHSSSNPVDPS